MEMLKDLIREFCDTSEKYEFCDDYSGKDMEGATCPGIVIRPDNTFVETTIEFFDFLESKNYEDLDFETEDISFEDLGDKVIVYFPYAKN